VLFGVTATILLHLLLVAPLLIGGQTTRSRTNEQGAEASGVPAMVVVDVNDEPSEESESANHPALPDTAIASPTRLLIPVGGIQLKEDASLSSAISDSDDASRPRSGNPDQSERALMFGRYLGQVTARVERAWLRPRSPIGSSAFTCLVQVEQDRERNVKEITLKRCNGTTTWQLSLVRAIESASPFPAPPDPAVFSQELTLEMNAEPFEDGGSAEGYEPVQR
jgi:hypothetical protein